MRLMTIHRFARVILPVAVIAALGIAGARSARAGDDSRSGRLPSAAAALRRTIDGGASVEALLARWPNPAPYRSLLFYGDGKPVRAAAQCLVRLGDDVVARRILERVEQGELRTARYPARLFGWIVGTRYDVKHLRRLNVLLKRNDRHARIFALEALNVMTYASWRMPAREPDFANPGEVWRMRRFLARYPKPDAWLRVRVERVARRLGADERAAAARFLSGFRYPPRANGRRPR